VTLQQAIDLSYIHSREYQFAIEDLYLTALAVTQEQFNLGVRYLGPGVRVPGATASVTDNPGGPDTVGFSPRFGAAQLLPAGTQLAVELANNTLWLFGGGTSSSASTLAFSLTQPLLFRAGRKVVLEALTQSERNVLYSARDLARFRQTLFTGVASEFLRIQQQLQLIRNTEGNIQRLQEQIKIRREQDDQTPQVVKWDLARLPDDATIPESIADSLSHDDRIGVLVWDGYEMTKEQQVAVLSVSQDEIYQAAAKDLIQQRFIRVTSLPAAQLATQLNSQRNSLEDQRRQLADSTDRFKINLGLPPNIDMSLDDSLLFQFELIDPNLYELDSGFQQLMEERGQQLIIDSADIDELGEDALVSEVRMFASDLLALNSRLAEQVQQVEQEFIPVDKLLADSAESASSTTERRRRFRTDEERTRVERDVTRDRGQFDRTHQDFLSRSETLQMLAAAVSAEGFPQSLDTDSDGVVSEDELPQRWREFRGQSDVVASELSYRQVVLEATQGLLQLRENIPIAVRSLQVFQAGLRVEQIALNRFVLPGSGEFPAIDEVVRIGLERRHDLMNQRALVMDARRAVEVAASDLEATLDVTVAGTVGTLATSRKPFDFDDSAAGYTAGLALDTPADKLAERNIYNAALISYQRSRREYMALEDEVKDQIRTSWRQLKVSEERLEIDRQAVRVAALQLDIAAQPASSRNTSTNALDLLNALESVLGAQNSLLGDWITWEISRLNIYRDMGIMQLDERGLWIDPFYAQPIASPSDGETDVPPPLPPPTPSATDTQSDVAIPVSPSDTDTGDQE